MSTTIDEKVVEMRFDNKQFEANVATSLNTLDRLKKGLDLDGAAKGFDSLSNAAKRCDISAIGNVAEAVSSKFSALETIAVGALLKIGSQAVMAGEQLLKSLTLEPITTGFNEYELKMGSIQTIMASTGESLDRVNQKLDELNKYSDRTIYSFSDMTTNIGKFTNAGVKLDDAVAAIQGVSNVAAISGANASEASRAMYNFAQALSAGYVKLIDWKSIENANMATVEFKTQLLESAVAAGTLTKTADGMYKTLAKGTVIDATHMFNDSLQEQWMTTEVLTSTLKDYADETTEIGKKAFAAAQDVKTWTQLLDTLKESAQSGWAETWQLVAGNYEEAKTTLRTFSEFFSGIIDGSSDARNSLLQGALMSSWGQLKERVNETGISVDTFRDVLRETAEESVDGLSDIIEKAGSFDAALSEGWLTTDILADTLDNLVSKTMGATVKISELSDEQMQSVGYTQDQINALRALSKEAKQSDSNIATLVRTMGQQSGRELLFDSLLNIAKAIQGLLQTVKGAWQEIFPPVASEQIYSFIEALHSASERIRDFFTQVESGEGFVTAINEPLQNIKSTFKGIFAVLDIVKEAFSALWRVLAPAKSTVGGLLSGILGLTGSFGEWLTNLDETIKKNDTFYNAFKKVIDFIKGAITTVKEFAETIREKFHLPTLSEAKESIKSFLNVVKEKVGAPGLELLRNLFEKICERAQQVRDAIHNMKEGVVEAMSNIDGAVAKSKLLSLLTGIWEFAKKVGSAIASLLGKAVGGLIDMFKNADFSRILDFLNTLATGGFVLGLKKFLDIGNELKGSVGNFLDWAEQFGKGINNILDGVRGCLEAWQQNLKATALLKIAGAVAILAAALLVLSTLDSEKLMSSITAISVLFTELMATMGVMNKMNLDSKSMNKTATAMIKIGAALLILSIAMKNLGELEPEQLAEGLIGVGVLLAEIAVFMNTAKFSKGATKTATGMILFAAAIKILASAVKDLAGLSWEDMAKGLLGVGVLLAEVDVFLNTAKFSGKSVLTATGIVLLSAAIKILASACKDFGEMSWEEIAKGLASIGALLAEIAAFTRLTGDAKHVIATGLALIEIGAAMKIFASAMKSFSGMSWEEIAKGLVAMGGALAEVAIALKLMPKNSVALGIGLIAVGAALKIIASALGTMSGMSWEEIAKGLVAMGGALAELSIGLNLMNGTLKGSAALLIAATALAIFTPSLKSLGDMSWESIAKGLVAIAGAFAILGVAGAVLSPLVPAILGLSASLLIISVSSVAIGAGLMLIGAGLTAVSVGMTAFAAALATSATAIIAGLSSIILGIASLIPAVAEKIGEAIVVFCGVIANSALEIAEAVKSVVLSLVDMLITCVPAIADGALQLVVGVLEALVTYTPQIIDSIMQFLIEILEGIARNVPQLIQAAMDVIGAFFAGVISALSDIDADNLIKGIAAVGLLTGLVAALGLVAGLIPAAMVGVLGLGAVITELSLVLAAIGGLAQIPGLEWLISEGGHLLETIGTAIGGFVGGIAGGFMSGVSSSFPQIGEDLSAFMANVQPFIDGASSIKSDLLEGIGYLTGAILLITAADLIEGLTSWLTGGSSLADFGNELVPFGQAMVNFSNTIANLDADLVSKAATAGKTLAEMAATLPNSGGVVGFFTGDNDMDKFGLQLVVFGAAMVLFGQTVKGLDVDAVQNAAIAGKAMAELASTLPNTGGVVDFFAGGNDMDTFGQQLVPFGKAIKEYSEVVSGLDVDAVTNSAIAGSALVELANTVPNTGGVVTFFTGDNDLSTFGEQLIDFGWAMSEYSEAVSGINGDAIINSTIAGSALVELANTVPNTGGVVAFFAGDNDLGAFGQQIITFGEAMKAYSDAITGIDVDAISASTTAGQALAELQSTLPNVGGVVDFFTGGNDLGTFGEGIKTFGEAMRSYGEAVEGMDTEAVTASATAALALSQLQSSLPNMGGLVSFFTGGNDLSQFAAGIIPFGEAMKSYSNAVSGIEADAIISSAVAAQSLAELQSILPNVGGVMEFFTGGNDLGTFASGIIPFGEAMKSYGEAVANIKTDAISASATAAKSLSELQSTLPKVGGVMEFFTGGNDLGVFAEGIVPFGTAMKSYGEAVAEIDTDSIVASAIAAQSLAELQSTLPSVGGVMEFFTGGNDLGTFAAGIVPFGAAMKSYGEAVADIDADSITASAIAAQSLSELQSTLPNVGGVIEFFTGGNDLAKFGASLIPFGEAMKSYSNSVSGIEADAVVNSATAGQALVELANTLPKCGGLSEIFTGSNNLASFGDEIVAFGKDLGSYADAIKNVKPDAVTASANAAQALSNLATGLPDSSLFDKWFGGDQTLASFGRDISSFGEDMGNYYSKIASADLSKMSGVVAQVWSIVDLATGIKGVDTKSMSNFGKALKSLAEGGITEFTNAFSDSNKVTSSVNDMLLTVSNAISDNKAYATIGMQDVMAALSDVVTTKASEINSSVTTMMSGVSDTIRSKESSIKSAMKTVMNGALTAISDYYYQFYSTGENVVDGLIQGMKSKQYSVYLQGQSLALAALEAAKKALDSHSPSREFIYLGENIGEGLAIGVNNGIVPAASATSEMIGEVLSVAGSGIDAFEDWLSEKKYYNEISLKDELAGWEQLQKQYAEGSEERKKIDREVYRVQNELVAATYQYSLDWIEREKYYNRLSTQEELEAYERMQSRYMEGSKERMEIDKKVYSLRNQLMDESYQHSMNWIEEEKYYNRMTLSDELAAYKRVQSRYAKGTDERKKMDREVYRVEQEIYEAQQRYIADVQAVQEEAAQKRLDLEEEYADKVKAINEQLSRDIENENNRYVNALESRTNTLYNAYGLFDEVKEREDVSGDTLMKNLEDQVKEFSKWQDALNNLSARGLDAELISELQEMGPSSISQIKALESMSKAELDKYVALWQVKHGQARSQAVSELEGLRIETLSNIEQLRQNADRELEDYRSTWQIRLAQVNVDAEAQLTKLRQEFGEKVGLIKKDTAKETQEMVDVAQKILEEAGWDETGKQIVAGIREGIQDELPKLLDTITQMALESVKAVEDTLDIESPSKVFRRLGNFTGLGFVKGISDYAEKSYDAGSKVAEYAKGGLSDAIHTVSDFLNGDLDAQPTIRPVMDLSDVANGVSAMNSLFYNQKLLALAGQTNFAFAANSGDSEMTITVDNAGVIQELRSLRGEMADMTERMARMQVVLDSGTVVGELAGPMDEALGQRASFRRRGN